ncbi:MAG: glycosyltransferase family 4 protein [Desulfobacterales bacterium]|jgi:glycosyltransferase involved in cell wall biosynthesis|nr:glycosyltransferase family 4 protein [Desulfobacterales bacterium]
MRVGLVIRGRIDTLTGGYLYDRFLRDALCARGHRVDVISLPLKPYACSLLDNLSGKTAARLTDRRWDLLLQDGLCHPSLVLANRRIRARRKSTIIAVVHQVLCRQPRHRLLNCAYSRMERHYLRTIDGLLLTSRFTRDAARWLLSAGSVPMAVVPPAGDRLGRGPSRRAILERSHRSGPLELLFVGNLTPIKGLDRLLESLSRLPRTMWRLAVAGSLTADRRHTRAIRNLISGRGMQAQVQLLDAVDGERLRALLSSAQVFAMPFAHESFGIAALEAMAFGLPVIGSEDGGVREFVRHARNGFLVAGGDDAAVGRHLEMLHSDRARLAAMGLAAEQTFLASPSWAQSMQRACEFIEGVAGTRPDYP